jgi:hypothetical protein
MLDDLPGYRGDLTLQRFAAQSIGGDGYPVAQTPTTSTIGGSWQPATWTQLQRLEEGQRRREPRMLLTDAEVRTANQHDGTPADRLVVDGVVYEVHQVEPWASLDDLPAHWECICLRLQELPPAGGDA